MRGENRNMSDEEANPDESRQGCKYFRSILLEFISYIQLLVLCQSEFDKKASNKKRNVAINMEV